MPDAHTPIRNSLGDIVGGWSATIEYDEAADVVRTRVHLPGGQWRKERRWSDTWQPDEIEQALDALLIAVRTAGARRLF